MTNSAIVIKVMARHDRSGFATQGSFTPLQLRSVASTEAANSRRPAKSRIVPAKPRHEMKAGTSLEPQGGAFRLQACIHRVGAWLSDRSSVGCYPTANPCPELASVEESRPHSVSW